MAGLRAIWRLWPAAALVALACASGALGIAVAQETAPPAGLVADRVSYDRESEVLTAEGDVEVLYEGRVLRARRIVYDAAAGTIRATGPLVLTDPEGGVFLAETAELSPDLKEGLIAGARLLIAGRLQIAAAEMRRSGGRFTTLYRTVASTCTICAGDPTPTWSIRAARVTQDAVLRRIWFEDATLRVFGLPVAYLPRLSIPDPSVRRASGVLVPAVVRSGIYGFGAKLPYYRVLGPQADATLTPFVTTTGATLLEGEYRRVTRLGGFTLSGVLALADGLDGGTGGLGRGAFAATGAFALGDGFVAEFDIDTASDDDFLQQFDYSSADRLTSTVRIRRTRIRDHLELGAIGFQSLRDGEATGAIPFILPEFSYRRTLAPRFAGGRLAYDLDALGVMRDAGRDVLRAGGGGDWRRDWRLASGVLAATTASVQLDAYHSRDDARAGDRSQARAVPSLGVELRWPLVREQAGAGAEHVIEPIAQVFWSEALGDTSVPNEDSQLPQLDHTNLFALDRFPGRDRVETGLRANLGVEYLRYDPAGWTLGVTIGRVLRADSEPDFARGTGLAGRWSDYVAAFSLDFGFGLSVVERALFDPDDGFRRNELTVAYAGPRGALNAAYVYLARDATNRILGAQPETSELALDARWRFRPNWELSGLWRYDATTSSNIRTGGALTYGNECAEVDLSVSRRYTSSSNVPPATSVGFSVRLAGLGGSRSRDWPERVCTGRGT